MLEYTKRNPNTVLGFYVRPPFIAIDLDGGVEKEATDITDWASAIIREIGSYTELSPSGTGIHIIGLGTKPGTQEQNRERRDLHQQACAHRHQPYG